MGDPLAHLFVKHLVHYCAALPPPLYVANQSNIFKNYSHFSLKDTNLDSFSGTGVMNSKRCWLENDFAPQYNNGLHWDWPLCRRVIDGPLPAACGTKLN